ncbi:MAG: DEAD/DEAH box helicase, partial [Actinomycetes bacterium]
RTALDPHGSWVPAVLQAADTRLTEVRSHVPDAGGLVIATDQTSARAYAELLGSIAGQKPVLVLSDDASAGRNITRFAQGDQRWMVAVRMVSEGVDVPRLAVGVYATATATPLFFAQAVSRFVRARRRGETASVFVPSVARLLQFAAEMEAERDHVLTSAAAPSDEADLLAAAERTQTEADLPTGEFTALESEADFDRVVFEGGEFGLGARAGSAEEQEYLGLPGLLEVDQVRDLLRRRQADQVARPPAAVVTPSAHAELRALRRELNGLVAAWHHRTDTPHGVIHAELRTACGGPPSAVASADELRERITRIRGWATSRRG